MFFNEEFISSVEEEPIDGIVKACDAAFVKLKELDDGEAWNEKEHELLWEVASFVQLVVDLNGLKEFSALPEVTGDTSTNCTHLNAYLKSMKTSCEEYSVLARVDLYSNRYKAAFKGAFAYEFSQGDLERIQALINELRSHISENEDLEDDHKRRLLKRLEQLQLELHKRVSDLDRFWGLVGDAGVILGKLGEDAKPIVDRVKELAEIVWKTQARTEELPSNSMNPMIESDDST